MKHLLYHIRKTRSDVEWVRGTEFDASLPNQEEILALIASYDEATCQAEIDASIPWIVSPRQLRMALIISGFSPSSIVTSLEALSEPSRSLYLTEWEYALEFDRKSPTINSLAPMLGFTSEQMDALWSLAETL